MGSFLLEKIFGGFSVAKEITVELRREEADHLEPNPTSGFRGEIVLPDFHTPRRLVSRIKIWPRFHLSSYVSVGESFQWGIFF